MQSSPVRAAERVKAATVYTIVDARFGLCYENLEREFNIPGFDLPFSEINTGRIVLYPANPKCTTLSHPVYTGFLFGSGLQSKVFARTTAQGLAFCQQGFVEYCALSANNPIGTVTAVSQIGGRCYQNYPVNLVNALDPALEFIPYTDGQGCASFQMPILAGYLVGTKQSVPVYTRDEGDAAALCKVNAVEACAVGIFDGTQLAVVRVSEFYNARLDRYFRSADPIETTFLNTSPAAGESATGDLFNGYSAQVPGAKPVCRFYGSVNPGPNSHFYTLDQSECTALRQLQAQTPATQKRWNFESVAFYAIPPENGACPNTAPNKVYRAYNRGNVTGRDSNHRFTANLATYNQMIAKGWSGEGVVMCSPS